MVVMRRLNIKNLKISWPLLINIIGLIVSAILQSRAFMIGFLSAICFVWILKKPVTYRSKIKTRLIIASFFIAVIFLLSYYVKQDSSAGRMLIYKISWQMLKEHWVYGTGLGTFGHAFLNYQADYFAKGKYTIKELLLADNTKHAFNDYLQWVIETGIFGFFLLVTALLLLIFSFSRVIKIYSDHPDLLIIAISLQINILAAASFTHVFEIIYFQLSFIISLSIVTYYIFMLQRKELFLMLLSLSVILLGLNYYRIVIGYRNYKKMDDAKMLYSIGFIHKALQNCEVIYPQLHYDAMFLSLYSDILITSGNSSKALYVLKELLKIDNSYFFHIRLAECCQQTKDLTGAEKEYIIAINMVPNRFISRYKLFQFYCNIGKKEEALTTAYRIFHLPVKIPSEEIKAIKVSVQSELANRNWNDNRGIK